MKTVLWTMALMGSVLCVAWVVRQATTAEPPRPKQSHDERRSLLGRQGQPRHWRACVLQSR